MARYVLVRLLWFVPVLTLSAGMALVIADSTPGGPFDTNPYYRQMSPGVEAVMRTRFGMDLPIWRRFTRYLFIDIETDPEGRRRVVCGVICGEFGQTYSSRGTRSAQQHLFEPLGKNKPSRLYFSARLGLQALALAFLVGVPVGLAAALRQNSWLDHILTVSATFFFAVPPLLTGLFGLIIFAGRLNWFTVIPDWDEPLRPWVLPTLVLGLSAAAFIARLTRISMLEVRRADFVTTARAKGLAERAIALRHILRPACIPLVAASGPLLAGMITGSILIEKIFQVPGMGSAYALAIQRRDLSLLLALTLIFTFLLCLGNLLSDLLIAALDPRARPV